MDNIQNKIEDASKKVADTVESATNKVEETILKAKDALPEVTPTPPGLKPQSSVSDLKARLEWGEPALTILDVRDRDTFNNGHIMGAMPMPLEELVDRAKTSLQPTRDIYVYGESDEQTAQAASQMRSAGFQCVSELKGGFPAWKAVGGPTEGVAESTNPPGPEGYNVLSEVKNEANKPKANM
ncbi:rhodanese-like domain-containing protein [Funiculus sociatus GB2-A5]|uniref:Rhodanese-like domain-containing protein n=1 Tax=Funiculus sociatus GB2-A5 TaxID=2933946 RepID=A0ABV0JIF2_9CYAN|nr:MULTISPECIES: rhodanese-like domain-containing protein [Cyanophyceae]MBD1922500.1 rhodanese-like domain-containing protein [Microcoleus sp. FACHB-831]MBD1932141.1 rhodanese-like domain-containing protein [Trichocoleus sp. FACHB-69]MBD2065723.1 rhodanese-like domain-containing protein [Trichocoleus sp. FACHB-6]